VWLCRRSKRPVREEARFGPRSAPQSAAMRDRDIDAAGLDGYARRTETVAASAGENTHKHEPGCAAVSPSSRATSESRLGSSRHGVPS
jgi:hypothetical protein